MHPSLVARVNAALATIFFTQFLYTQFTFAEVKATSVDFENQTITKYKANKGAIGGKILSVSRYCT